MWLRQALFLLFPICVAAQPQRYDVVIHEIMADPSPAVGLPEAEYLELKNRSAVSINLQGWRVTSGSSVSGLLGSFVLQPDSIVILCAASQQVSFSQYGATLSVPSFPALANDGSLLSLISKDGRLIHAVSYAADWYRHAGKAEGGWSLEMIDVDNACTGQKNWVASPDAKGGSPGRENAAAAENKDAGAPRLLQALFPQLNSLLLVFDEPLDSASVQANKISMQPQQNFLTVQFADALQQQLLVQLLQPADSTLLYSVSVAGIKDCSGNPVQTEAVQSGVPRKVLPGEIVVNEILYHPRPGGSEYLELYNRSKKVADLAQMFLSSKGSTASTTVSRRISGTARYLLPGSYAVITESPQNLVQQYLVKNEQDIVTLSNMPSLSDDAGTVALSDVSGSVVDEVRYNRKWQFPLVVDDAGVALERIDPGGSSQDAANWHSAAATAGYGTPGYRNSQYLVTEKTNATVSIHPRIFSPDNDGHEDLALIRYQLNESGYVANLVVLNAAGQQVRHLVKNALLGKEGSWQWDGLNERNGALPSGPYIILTELFNLQGRKQVYKHVVIVASGR